MALLCLGALTPGSLVRAATSPIEARYQQQRQSCLDGSSNEDRATCLKEAGAAREADLRGRLGSDDATYGRNARARCDALRGDDAKDCLSRVRGEGGVSGSVRGGGILRETVTVTTGPVPPAPAPPN
jgi:hypothetical protein